MIRTHRNCERWRRYVALAVVVAAGFFAAQGEAVDAQQLRFDSSAPGLARFTVPPPVALAPGLVSRVSAGPASHRLAVPRAAVALLLALAAVASTSSLRRRARDVDVGTGSTRGHPPPDVRGPPLSFR